MDYKNKSIFYVSILIYLLIVFRESWLPGSNFLIGREPFIIDILTLYLLLVIFDFKHIINYENKSLLNSFLIIILILVLIFSTLFYNTQEILKPGYLLRFISFFFTILIYFFLLPRYLLYNNIDFKKVMLYGSILSLLVAIIGLIFYFINIFPDLKYSHTLTSIIIHPNYVPPIFLLGIFSSLYIYDSRIESASKTRPYLLIMSLLIQCLALILTFSRNGIIALLLGMAIYFTLKFKKKIIYLLPFLLILVPVLRNVFISKGYASFISRFYLLVPAYYMLSANTEKLFWGYGLTHNFEVFKRYMLVYNPFDEASITQTINNPHNSFISIILMFGLYFFFALTSFVIIILAKFLKTYIFNKHIANKNQYIIILSAFTSLLAMGLFEGQLVQPEFFNIQPCLFFMGIMYYLNKFKRSYSLN